MRSNPLPQLVRTFRQIEIDGGVLTLTRNICQAVFTVDSIGRRFPSPQIETWIAPSLREARRNFVLMANRWSAA